MMDELVKVLKKKGTEYRRSGNQHKKYLGVKGIKNVTVDVYNSRFKFFCPGKTLNIEYRDKVYNTDLHEIKVSQNLYNAVATIRFKERAKVLCDDKMITIEAGNNIICLELG